MAQKKKREPAPVRERLHKKYTLPAGCDCSEFVMRELDGRDDITIGVWMDQKSSVVRGSEVAALALERQEAIRVALVEVDGARVNEDGIPWSGFDTWSKKTLRFAQMAFNDLNGMEVEELEKFRSGAVVVGLRSVDEEDQSDPSTDEPDSD